MWEQRLTVKSGRRERENGGAWGEWRSLGRREEPGTRQHNPTMLLYQKHLTMFV